MSRFRTFFFSAHVDPIENRLGVPAPALRQENNWHSLPPEDDVILPACPLHHRSDFPQQLVTASATERTLESFIIHIARTKVRLV